MFLLLSYHHVLSPPISCLEVVFWHKKRSYFNIYPLGEITIICVRGYFRGGKLEQKLQEAVQLGGPEAATAAQLQHPTLHTLTQRTPTGGASLMAWPMVVPARVEITATMRHRRPHSRLRLSCLAIGPCEFVCPWHSECEKAQSPSWDTCSRRSPPVSSFFPTFVQLLRFYYLFSVVTVYSGNRFTPGGRLLWELLNLWKTLGRKHFFFGLAKHGFVRSGGWGCDWSSSGSLFLHEGEPVSHTMWSWHLCIMNTICLPSPNKIELAGNSPTWINYTT